MPSAYSSDSSLDEAPVAIKDEVETASEEANARDDGVQDTGQVAGSENIDEKTVANALGFIERLVFQRIVEDK